MNNNTNTGKLKLTPQQRKSLFAGNAPSISGEGPCPVAPGYVYRLSERLTLEVEVVRHPAPDKWTLLYCVKDKRDPVRKLRRVPPVHVDDADSTVPTEDALKDAAEESAYTSMPSSLSDAGEAPPRAVVDAYALRASQQDAARRQTLLSSPDRKSICSEWVGMVTLAHSLSPNVRWVAN
jgi:hypothetical protein